MWTAIRPTEALNQGFEFASRQILPSQIRAESLVLQRQGIRIAELNLMLAFDEAKELADMPDIFHLPNTPTWFLGMSNVHGALVPVFDVAEFLNLSAMPTTNPMLLILGHDEFAAAIRINGIPRRLKFAESQRVEIDDEQCLEYSSGLYRINNENWIDFQYKILLEKMRAALVNA